MRDCRSVPTFLRDAFPWGKVVRLKPDRMRGGRQYRFLCRGGGMPRPPEFYTQKLRGTISCLPLTREVARRQPRRRECPTPRSRGERFLRKAFSPGLCPAQRIEITMTAGGSHTTTTRCHAFWRDGCGVHRCTGQSGNLYRVPSTPVTACAVPPSPAGEGFSLSRQPLRRFLPLRLRYPAGEACHRPYIAPAGISPGFFTPLLHFGKVYDILFPDKMQYFVREYGCFSLGEYGRIGGCGSDCLDSGQWVRAFTT